MKFSPRQARPIRVCVAAGVAFAMLGSWFGAAPAGAHDGTAEIEVDAAHPSTESVHFIVKVTWEDDGHPAAEATVTARATSPSGEDGDPVTLEPQGNPEEDGLYQGSVDMSEPGDWTVLFSSLDPDGDLEHTETIAAEEEPAVTTTEVPEESEESEEPAEEPEPTVVQTNPDADLTVEEGDDSDDGPSLALLLAAFAVLGVVVAGAFWFVMKRKDAQPDASTEAGDASTDVPDDEASSDSSAES